jgi:hypothetical protein
MGRVGYPSGRDGTAAGWPYNAAVTSAEYAWFALGVYNAISETGGTYSLASALVIGGSAVTFSGYSTSFYGVTVSGNTSLGTTSGDQLSVNATADFYAATSFLSGVQFLGDTSNVTFATGTTGAHASLTFGAYMDGTVHGDWLFNGYLHAVGNVAFDGGTSGTHKNIFVGEYVNISINGPTTIESGAALAINCAVETNSTVTNNGAVTNNAAVLNSGTVQNASTTTQTGAFGQTYVVKTATGSVDSNTRYVSCNISGGGDLTISAGGSVTGQIITFSSSTNGTVNIKNPGGTTLHQLIVSGGSNITWVDMLWDGSTWMVFRFYL